MDRLLIQTGELKDDPGDIVLGILRERLGGFQSLIEQLWHGRSLRHLAAGGRGAHL